jgi:hypothetical protein
MPGPEYAGIVAFYEDFPYAWWNAFNRLEDLPGDPLAAIPPGVAVTPEYADVGDQIERKITGIGLYASQLERLFDDRRQMAESVRAFGTRVAALGGRSGFAERYWASSLV